MSLGSGVADGGANGGSTSAAGGQSGNGAPPAGTAAGSGTPATGGSGNGGGASSTGAGATSGTAPSSQNLGTGDKGTTSWRDTLPDDLKANPTLSKYSDLQNLAKAHIELQKKIGEKGIFKPAKDASPEEIKAFREALGIPTEIDKYDMGQFEGVKVDDAIVKWAKEMGVKHGIEPAAFKEIIGEYMKIEANNGSVIQQTKKTEVQAGLDTLKKEWGDAFGQNIQKANFVAQKIGGQALVDRLIKYGAENDPVILKAFSEASKLYGEDRLREGGVSSTRQTPQELDGEISAVQQQMFALKPGDGRLPSLKQRYESLWKQKTGGK